MSTASFAEVPDDIDTPGEPVGAAATARPAALGAVAFRAAAFGAAAFGAGAAALLGVAAAAGPSAATVTGQSELVIATPYCNTTCCVEEPGPPSW